MAKLPFIPYGKQFITEDDIEEVVRTMRSDWLTTGPKVEEFESALANYCGVNHSVAVNSGTAALHCAMAAVNIQEGDEIIVPAISFVATANCVVYQGGIPIFADVDAASILIDAEDVAKKITAKTKAIIAVDYGGQAADYAALRSVIGNRSIHLVADACHALGGADSRGQKVGSLADLSTFSFHPVKPITSGEGGAITTDSGEYAQRMRVFRNHGIDTDHRQREKLGSWHYDMKSLGYNYRITDFQCALAISQLKKLDAWIERREIIAQAYIKAFAGCRHFSLQSFPHGLKNAWHLFVIRLHDEKRRDMAFSSLRERGIGVNVHYRPIYHHTFYRKAFPSSAMCPKAERVFSGLLTLPMHIHMTDDDVQRITDTVLEVVENS